MDTQAIISMINGMIGLMIAMIIITKS